MDAYLASLGMKAALSPFAKADVGVYAARSVSKPKSVTA